MNNFAPMRNCHGGGGKISLIGCQGIIDKWSYRKRFLGYLRKRVGVFNAMYLSSYKT